MGSKIEVADGIAAALASKMSMLGTAAGAVDAQGQVNGPGVALGIAQTMHGVVDLGTKGMQTTGSVLGKAVPGVGGILGGVGLWQAASETNPFAKNSNIAGGIGSLTAIGAAVAVFVGAPVVATVLGVTGLVAGGVQIYSLAKENLATPPITDTAGLARYDIQRANAETHMAAERTALSAAITTSESSNRAQARVRMAQAAAAQVVAVQAQQAAAVAQAAQVERASRGLTQTTIGNDGTTYYGTTESPYAYTANEYSARQASRSYSSEGSPSTTPSSDSNSCRASDYSNSTTSNDNDVGGFWPIVIDLNGDGVKLQTLGNSTARFDADDDGYRESTAWASNQDGILMIDEGGDGLVTQAKEIAFANWTTEADTDLQALAKTFDSNHDGVLDAQDARFADFKIWRDANGDGVSDAGEVMTLAQAGIKSMNLTVKDGTGQTLADGTQVFGLADVQRTDGSIIQAADVAFAYNTQGFRTTTDANGNTVYAFESGSALRYRNIAQSTNGAISSFSAYLTTACTVSMRSKTHFFSKPARSSCRSTLRNFNVAKFRNSL